MTISVIKTLASVEFASVLLYGVFGSLLLKRRIIVMNRQLTKSESRIIFILLLCIFCLFLFQSLIQKNPVSTVKNAAVSNSNKASPEESNLIIIKNNDIAYTTANLIKTYKVTPDPVMGTDVFEFYDVGRVLSGPYSGYNLVRGEFVIRSGPCKGPGCSHPLYNYFLMRANNLILLPQVSDIIGLPTNGWFVELKQIKDFNVTENNNIVLGSKEMWEPRFSYNRMNFNLVDTEKGLPNDKLYKVFDHPILGAVYTTKSMYSPQEPFYNVGGRSVETDDNAPYVTSGGWGNGVESCRNEECYQTNGFFVFRPDGTFSIYQHTLLVDEDSFLLGTKTYALSQYDYAAGGGYFSSTRLDCSGNDGDYVSITSPDVIAESDLQSIATTIKTHQDILFFKDAQNTYLKHFYTKYKKDLPEFQNDTPDKLALYTYDAFVKALPVLFWKDQFGRLIRFTNKQFVPPEACEPVVYLYPQKDTVVNVKIDQKRVTLSETIPTYNNGWNVLARPNGELTSLNKVYPYLFWEGTLKILPQRQDGFVVEKTQLEQFFKTELPKLGLNNNETNDFIKVWVSALDKSPFYFITFVDPTTIDTYIPLIVTPKPHTIIRVLMDYMPLQQKIHVSPFKYPTVLPRTGFTLVEWGALER